MDFYDNSCGYIGDRMINKEEENDINLIYHLFGFGFVELRTEVVKCFIKQSLFKLALEERI